MKRIALFVLSVTSCILVYATVSIADDCNWYLQRGTGCQYGEDSSQAMCESSPLYTNQVRGSVFWHTTDGFRQTVVMKYPEGTGSIEGCALRNGSVISNSYARSYGNGIGVTTYSEKYSKKPTKVRCRACKVP